MQIPPVAIIKPKITKPLLPLHSDRRATHGDLTNKREKAYIQHVQAINNRSGYANLQSGAVSYIVGISRSLK